jgi:hypothetical protein
MILLFLRAVNISFYRFLFCFLLLIVSMPVFSQNLIKNVKVSMNHEHIVVADEFPAFGKWMLNYKFQPANWLKITYKGKTIHEPINIIIIDSISKSHEEAVNSLYESCKIAGYSGRGGHSTKYKGYIGGCFFKQMPSGAGEAFSDNHYYNNNNHGRIFGPYLYNEKYYFIASLSREKFSGNKHLYDSFIKARNDFAEKMSEKTGYKISGKVNLENAISSDDPKLTTGDHDGQAVIITRE